MLHPHFAVYLGEERENGFSGFISEEQFFVVLEVEEGLGKEEGRQFLKDLGEKLQTVSVTHLSEFDSMLTSAITEANLPLHLSLAAGLRKGDGALLLKTIGVGKAYLKRGKQFACIISGNNSASGHIEADDFVIFTTESFSKTLGTDDMLKKFLDRPTPHEIIDILTPQIKTQDDRGVIALVLTFQQDVEEQQQVEQEQKEFHSRPALIEKTITKTQSLIAFLRSHIDVQDKRKRTVFVLVLAVFVALVWSIVVGYQRRSSAAAERALETTKELVQEKLNQAEDVAFLNVSRATALINDAKVDVKELKQLLKGKRQKEVVKLEGLIQQTEEKLLQKEERESREYYDLSLENKGASASKIYLDEDNAFILDARGTIYLVSLAKKSVDVKKSSGIQGASLIAGAGDRIYFYRNKGIYRIEEDNKVKKVINNEDWGTIASITTYNNNLYLLDKQKNDIYKYVPTEEGFQKNHHILNRARRQTYLPQSLLQ